MNISKISKATLSSRLDNEGLIHIQVKGEDKKVTSSQFQTLKYNYQRQYTDERSAQRKAELVYSFIKNLAYLSAIEIKYNAVIEINCNLSYPLYLYVKTEHAGTVWHIKIIPSEDIKLVGPLLHKIIINNASN